MLITIANHQSDFELKTILEAAEFYIKKLIPEEVYKDIEIYIEICDGLNLTGKKDPDKTLEGYAADETEEDDEGRFFYIALRRTDPGAMLVTLAHEMVHVKQMAMDEMKKFYVDGKLYCRYLGYDYRVDSLYDDMPWEQEAYALEMVLVSAWGNR